MGGRIEKERRLMNLLVHVGYFLLLSILALVVVMVSCTLAWWMLKGFRIKASVGQILFLGPIAMLIALPPSLAITIRDVYLEDGGNVRHNLLDISLSSATIVGVCVCVILYQWKTHPEVKEVFSRSFWRRS